MKKFIILFFFAICYLNSNVWERLEIEDVNIVKKIICVDSNNCFLLSAIKLYKSTNGGKNWKLIDTYPEFSIEDMSCPDKNHIFVAMEDGEMRTSTDGGENFKGGIIDSVKIFNFILMLDSLNGITANSFISQPVHYILNTKDGWQSYEKYNPEDENHLLDNKLLYVYYLPRKIDKENLVIWGHFSDISIPKKSKKFYNFLLKLDIFTLEYEMIKFENIFIKDKFYFNDFKIVTDSLYFLAGNTNVISGGTGHDAIFKTTDAGKSWRKVLDFRPTDEKMPGVNYWGLQKIAFKNDSIGIAVGQFGKIVYTYDGGESWIYEKELPENIHNGDPPTMVIEYAGDTPIIGDFGGNIHIMTEDTYAPKPEDTLTISGRVALNGQGLEGVAVTLNTYRITMTDENGNYKFRKLPKGNHIVKAINKYVDYGPHTDNFYEPFLFSSEYNINLTDDTTNIDFEATDNRNFYSLSGSVTLDNKGLEDIVMQFGSNTVTTNEEGFFIFDSVEQWRHNLTPITEGYNYEPEFYDVTLNQNLSSMDFKASTTSSVTTHTNFQLRNNVLISEEIAGMNYRVIALSGRVVKSSILPKELNLNAEQTGTYILHITKGEQVIYSHKVQVVR